MSKTPTKGKVKLLNNVENSIIMKHSRLSIILIYNIVTIFTVAAFYPLLPIMMNYAPDINEIIARISISSPVQYIIMLIPSLLVGSIVLGIVLKDVSNWERILKDSSKENIKKIKKIRKKCINLPYLIYVIQVFLITISVGVIFSIITVLNNTPIVIVIKVLIVLFSLFSLSGIISLIFSKRIFTNILIRTYNDEKLEGNRIGLKNKILLQMLPVIVVAILFTSLIGYSRLVEEKGVSQFRFYKEQLENKFQGIVNVKDIEQLNSKLKEIILEPTGCYFVVTPKGEIISSNGSVFSTIFNIEMKEYSQLYNGRVYDEIGLTNAATLRLKGDNGIWMAGIKYDILPNEVTYFFIFNLIILLIINTIILYYFSKTLAEDISLVADSLNEIAEGETVNLEKKISVTSNDEIADLVIAFNKIQEREKDHIQEIKEAQEILAEQERLASLGQLIGGIAHNLRTPIMSLSGGIEGLKDLINEYHDSIGDDTVTSDDHFEIVKEMRSWVEKMKPHCSYMSDIITAVKEQTVQPGTGTGMSFTLEELERRIDILLDHELRKRRCRLNMEFDVLKSTVIPGEISNMVQVLSNLIVNAAHAYERKGGDIDMKIVKKEKNIEFSIKDSGVGIPTEVQERLFKEMVTTKGKKGTGLGLYMSYSNIKARFGGKMWFESEDGKGATFYVSVPIK